MSVTAGQPHVDSPSPHVDWSSGGVELLTEARPWPESEQPRRAAVSSFGISGTNAHLILEQAPTWAAPSAETERPAPDIRNSDATEPLIWTISGKNSAALHDQATALLKHLQAKPDVDARRVGWSLASSRSAFEHRAAIVGTDAAHMLQSLRSLIDGSVDLRTVRGIAREARCALVFPGQGGQWPGMGRELWAQSGVFRDTIGKCDEALQPFVDWSLVEALTDPAAIGLLERVDVVQPVLFALMVGLARLWEQFGLRADAVVGHSQGEIAAAHIAGALSLEKAAKVVALRSRALVRVAGSGGMLSVNLAAEAIADRIRRAGLEVSIAAVNGPEQVVVSGPRKDLEGLTRLLTAQQIRVKRIPVDYAAHSSEVEILREELLTALADLDPQATRIPFHSTVIGEVVPGTDLTAEYWYRNLRECVQFHQVNQALLGEGTTRFVELSPHPVLSSAMEATADEHLDQRVDVIATLRRDNAGMSDFVQAVATAHTMGASVQFTPLYAERHKAPVELPTYRFQHSRYWLDPAPPESTVALDGAKQLEHPFLHTVVELADGQTLFSGTIDLLEHPWLNDHQVLGNPIFPATAILEVALEVAAHRGLSGLDELVMARPLCNAT